MISELIQVARVDDCIGKRLTKCLPGYSSLANVQNGYKGQLEIPSKLGTVLAYLRVLLEIIQFKDSFRER